MNTSPFKRALYEMFLRLSNGILRTICVIAYLGVNPVSAEEAMSLSIESPAFSQGGAIPTRYTCMGEDLSPALSWSGVPDGARSLVLIVDDPDAPDPRAPRMTWVH